MNRSGAPKFEAELRTSPNPVIALLLVSAAVLGPLAWSLPNPSTAQNVALLLWGLSGAAWLLGRRNARIGCFSTVVAVTVVIHAVHAWLGVPGFLSLLAIPTVLAAAMMGLPTATALAVGQSLLLVPGFLARSITTAEATIALLGIWVMLGMMCAVHRPVRQLSRWCWEHFERARDLLEEARNRQADLKDALDALAHANRQLALANDKLAAMRLVAEEARKAKAAFVANVSHEFRTPLNMIIGLVDLVMETPEVYGEQLPQQLLHDLEIVQRNCDHLASMINDVLDLSQIQAGRLGLHKDYLDFREVIDKAVSVVSPLLRKKAVSLGTEIPDDLPQVYCDPTRIRQVILNLLSNAARVTEEGSITIRASAGKDHVVVSVADTGPGIAPEDAQRIFEPFHQASRPIYRQANKSGSGLGLSISKEFVEMHGGRMWLESQRGVGSTFHFRLPISPLAGPAAPPQRWIAEGWVERTARAETPIARLERRVILCDGNGELWSLFSRYSDQVEFVNTRNLTEVSRQLKRTAAQAVVINATSPDRLWPLVEQASSQMPDMPIIGCSLPRRAENALGAGAKAYLLKPLTRADLQVAFDAVGEPVKRVLVVDDETDARTLLTRRLHVYDSDLQVITASSGQQALEQMRSNRPDLVLLDMVMPDMDGWQVLDIKAQDEATQDLPVVVISGRDPQDEPMSSRLILGTMGAGLSISKLLRCSGELSALMLQPD